MKQTKIKLINRINLILTVDLLAFILLINVLAFFFCRSLDSLNSSLSDLKNDLKSYNENFPVIQLVEFTPGGPASGFGTENSKQVAENGLQNAGNQSGKSKSGTTKQPSSTPAGQNSGSEKPDLPIVKNESHHPMKGFVIDPTVFSIIAIPIIMALFLFSGFTRFRLHRIARCLSF